MAARVNRARDPRGQGSLWSFSGVAATITKPTSGGSANSAAWYRAAVTATQTTSPLAIFLDAAGTSAIPVTAGEAIPFSVDLYASRAPSAGARLDVTWINASGGTVSTATGSLSALPAGVWTRLSGSFTAPAGAAFARPSAALSGVTPMVSGDIIGATALLFGDTGDFFDGASADSSTTRYDWTGTAHASTSTATPWVDVSLVPSGDPNPVQIVITGIPNGVAYDVVGTATDGSTWPVPGGSGTSTGAQIVLIDNRSALNTPVTYTAAANGTTYESAQITVPYAGRYVIQSLDGQTIVPFVWRDNGDPREYDVNSAAFPVAGRARPAVRYATGGAGGGALEVRTDIVGTRALEAILLSGRPVVLRTDGTIRDIAPVELVLFQGRPSNRSWGGLTAPGVVAADRVWSLEYVLVDDPEPSAVLSAWTWDDFDDAMSSRTWANFDTLFASSTWDQFDTYPWGQLS